MYLFIALDIQSKSEYISNFNKYFHFSEEVSLKRFDMRVSEALKTKILVCSFIIISFPLCHCSVCPYLHSCMINLSIWSGYIKRRRGRWRRSAETWRRSWILSTGERWPLRLSPYLSLSRKTKTRKSKSTSPLSFFFRTDHCFFSICLFAYK